MNILVASPHIPSPTWGASTRNYYLLKALSSRHTVTLLALGERAGNGRMVSSTAPLKNLPSTVYVISPPKSPSKRWQQLLDMVRGQVYVLNAHTLAEMQHTIDTVCTDGVYDAVLFESVFMAGYRLPRGVKVIIDEHNIEYELRYRAYQQERDWMRKWFYWLESARLKPIEIERCRNADIVLVTSERERSVLQEFLPGHTIEVVQNGVDIERFDGNGPGGEVPGRIIFTGSMEYYPNVHAALFFAQKCWPLIRKHVPHATWYIVGKNPLPEVRKLAELPGITVTGSVADVRPYIASAEVSIAPLLIGSGTRLKILEALAMRRAVVSTSLGCEGLTGISGKHWMVADQPVAFAQAVITLLGDPAMRKAFGDAGRALVEAEYSWGKSGTRLLCALEKCISNEGAKFIC